jgi:hypothetical protein
MLALLTRETSLQLAREHAIGRSRHRSGFTGTGVPEGGLTGDR